MTDGAVALDAPVPPIPPPTLPLRWRHEQTILADPDLHAQGVYGNCLQAAIATLLNVHLDAVPHFAQFAWWEGAFVLWLRGHGLDATWVGVEDIPETGPHLLLGRSPRGWAHVAVGTGRDVIWDTHPSHAGLTDIEGAVLVHQWRHDDPRCWACKRGPVSNDGAPMAERDATARLAEAIKDLCWRLVPYGDTDPVDRYIVTAGTCHRLIAAAQAAGISAAFRHTNAQELPDA